MGTVVLKKVLVMLLIGLLIGLPVPPGYAQAPVAGESPPPAPLGAATGGAGRPDRALPG